ncbi:MAG: CoA-binding protein, partial [Deltaproteobacteria bacterium]|nr:CoA-binding protein [Deltaproteobacteria bacterium]
MSILADKNTRLLVQGMGRMGQFHAGLSVEYGTQVVGGVHPGRGGSAIDGIPIFDTVAGAVAETGADASVIFVPPPGAADAILEAADAGLSLAVCITEGIPALDMLRAKAALADTGMRLVGPNCPGVV